MLILTVMVLDFSASLTAAFLTHNDSKLEFNGFDSEENFCVINREISNLFMYHSIIRHTLIFLNYWLSNFVEFVFIHQTNIVYAPLFITEITDMEWMQMEKWITFKVAQNSFQILMGDYNHSLSLDATIMVSENCPAS